MVQGAAPAALCGAVWQGSPPNSKNSPKCGSLVWGGFSRKFLEERGWNVLKKVPHLLRNFSGVVSARFLHVFTLYRAMAAVTLAKGVVHGHEREIRASEHTRATRQASPSHAPMVPSMGACCRMAEVGWRGSAC